MFELIIDSLKSALIYPFYKATTYEAYLAHDGFIISTFIIFILALTLGHMLNYMLGSCMRGILKDSQDNKISKFLSSDKFKLYFLIALPLCCHPLAGGFISLSAGLVRTNKYLTAIIIAASLIIYQLAA